MFTLTAVFSYFLASLLTNISTLYNLAKRAFRASTYSFKNTLFATTTEQYVQIPCKKRQKQRPKVCVFYVCTLWVRVMYVCMYGRDQRKHRHAYLFCILQRSTTLYVNINSYNWTLHTLIIPYAIHKPISPHTFPGTVHIQLHTSAHPCPCIPHAYVHIALYTWTLISCMH